MSLEMAVMGSQSHTTNRTTLSCSTNSAWASTSVKHASFNTRQTTIQVARTDTESIGTTIPPAKPDYRKNHGFRFDRA